MMMSVLGVIVGPAVVAGQREFDALGAAGGGVGDDTGVVDDGAADGAVLPGVVVARLMDDQGGGKEHGQRKAHAQQQSGGFLGSVHALPSFLHFVNRSAFSALIAQAVKNGFPGVPLKTVMVQQVGLNFPQLLEVEMDQPSALLAFAVKWEAQAGEAFTKA